MYKIVIKQKVRKFAAFLSGVDGRFLTFLCKMLRIGIDLRDRFLAQ